MVNTRKMEVCSRFGSIEVKLNIMDKYQIAGLASWRLGFEKPVVWDKIEEYMNR